MTKKHFGFLILGILITAMVVLKFVNYSKHESQNQSPFNTSGQLTLNVYQLEDGYWAYKLLTNKKPFIIQEHIPGVAGVKKFKTKTDAEKCGELVLIKIQNSQPPSITRNELDSLKISY